MFLIILAYLGGVLTILSPCILPVLPFVFARAGQPFLRSGLPLLAGMALTFAAVATLAAVGGGWVVHANQYGRWLAIALLALFGLALLLPKLAGHLARPLLAFGNRLSQSAGRTDGGKPRAGSSLLLGIATGLLWAPCAGPILGLLLTGAALQGANVGSTLLLLAYAAGAATSLALALLIGGRVFATMKRSLGTGAWIRRGLGAAMLCGVVAIGLGWDTGVLAQLSTATTSGLEQKLIDRLGAPGAPGNAEAENVEADDAPWRDVMTADASPAMAAGAQPAKPAAQAVLPQFAGAVQWLNSPPLTPEALRGKVVLVNFWTYSCINCLRTLPYIEAWAKKYRDQGLVVVGVHTPEFAFERNVNNVRQAIAKLGIDYPVAVDNNFSIWQAFNNQYWPAHYLIDAQGRARYHHFGESGYARSERMIQQLLTEAGDRSAANGLVDAPSQGIGLAADDANLRSQETYIGYRQASNFASPGIALRDQPRSYTEPAALGGNHWALAGDWTIGGEYATLDKASGRITYRFHARDLHLVMGPGKDNKPVRFRVSIDGAAPGKDHGTDAGPDGAGTVTEQRLYQLVRQAGSVVERTFTIEFLDPGVQAYAFTFG